MPEKPMKPPPNLEEYYAEQEREAKAEVLAGDPVHQKCRYVAFVSRSKGLIKSGPRRGQRRYRKHWQEVELVRYGDGKITQLKNWPIDQYATEILGPSVPADMAVDTLLELLPDRARWGVQ